MPLSYTVSQYVADLRAIRNTGSATAETSFYPPLDHLFNAIGERLKPAIRFSSQLRNQGAGMPDGGFFPLPTRSPRSAQPPILTNPERGAVEIKPAGYSLDTLTQSAQTLRYLQQYGLVLLTNLHEFRLVGLTPAGTPRAYEKYILARTPDDLWYRPLDPKHNDLLPDFLKRVMLYKVPLTQPKDVAWLLASYAREARSRAEDHNLPAFRNVKLALEESLGIQFEGEKGEHFFRSTLVQTLFYGIFSAWVLWRHSPEGRVPHALFNWRLADDYLKIPILRKLFREVSDRHHLNSIQLTEILELAGEALNRVDASVIRLLEGEQAVAYFYEPFLEAFDPQLRKDLGVWYTPREIVHYMVERIDHLLRTELHQPLGLASPAVRILDPCCGTGAYLTAVLQCIHRTLLHEAGDDTALVPAALRTAAITRVFGFEIMPAPFVIAHMEIARLLEDAGSPLQDSQRAGIFLTNALTGWVPVEHPQILFAELEEEREAADDIKQQGTILVILGNPPYNGYAGIAKIEEERDLTLAYRYEVPGLPVPEGQGLNELYVRFFRIAERRIAGNSSGVGIVSFISNYSWLYGSSHPTMRYKYLNTFQKLYIDNLNGDKYRTGKTTPDGEPDPSAFSTSQNREGIQVGTAIATLVRSGGPLGNAVLIRDLWGTKKLSHLERESRREFEPSYNTITPVDLLGLPFLEGASSLAYTTWPRLPELFPISSPGVKTSRDPLLVDIDREQLETRMTSYLGSDTSDSDISRSIPSAMQSSARFDPFETRRRLQSRGFRAWQIYRYVYRPYDMRWLYWEPTTKLLDEKREDYVLRQNSQLAFVIAQKSRTGYKPPQIVTSLMDLNATDGGANVFHISEIGHTLLDESSLSLNQSQAAIGFAERLGAQPTSLFLHALSTMHTPIYRVQNGGALLADWPRIPLPSDIVHLEHSAALGSRLTDLLDPESSIRLVAQWSFLAALKLPAPQNLVEHLQITAGWGSRGQGSTVMPGRGKAIPRPWTAAERDRLATLAATQSLTIEAALTLLGETCLDIHLNGHAFWSAVPANVWTYTLGGYQVLKKWLSYREATLLGRPLHPEESDYFAQVVRRITAILLLGPALDASYAAILPTATGLPTA